MSTVLADTDPPDVYDDRQLSRRLRSEHVLQGHQLRMKKQIQTATSLPQSPEDERRVRMVKYSIAMIVRMLCIFAMLFVQGWWLLIFAAGAIFLPYFAVIIANAQGSTVKSTAQKPSSIVLHTQSGVK